MPEYVVHAAMLLLAMLGGVRGFAPEIDASKNDKTIDTVVRDFCDRVSGSALRTGLCKEGWVVRDARPGVDNVQPEDSPLEIKAAVKQFCDRVSGVALRSHLCEGEWLVNP